MIALVNAVLQLWPIEADWAVTAMGQTSNIKWRVLMDILSAIYLGLLWLDLHDACRQDRVALVAEMTARLQNQACLIGPPGWRDNFMGDIRILGRKSSVNVQLVLWTLDELNLAYQRVDAGFTYGVVDTDAFKQMNPNGLVPVLIDGDSQPIFESASVLRYLANQYGDCLLYTSPSPRD